MATNRKLGRTTDIRMAMLKNLTTDLLVHGKIETTLPRAKEVKAIADNVQDALTEYGIEPRSKEGYQTQNWILLDYGDVMVHVFDEENRGFYNLEKLWKDAPYVDIDTLA